jgi:hypothetical protein
MKTLQWRWEDNIEVDIMKIDFVYVNCSKPDQTGFSLTFRFSYQRDIHWLKAKFEHHVDLQGPSE